MTDAHLDPASPELLKHAKLHIRKRMRALRLGYSPASLEKRSERIVHRALASLERDQVRSVASFWPMAGRAEVDLRKLDAALRERGVQLHYPFMTPLPAGGFRTGFALTDSADELRDRGRGFLEPDPARVVGPNDLDIVLVPALAADATGMRIGYGAGYYDATLGDVRPPARAWIVVFDFQLLAELPSEAHDVACDLILTDERELTVTSRP